METNNSAKSETIQKAEAHLSEQTASAPVAGGTTNTGENTVQKKYWSINDAKSGHKLEFFPNFLV
ncbi:MAG: hypothetical protein KGI71_06100, partial [Patescibacteria group bacterium]|nr:hypothetical protein [Patescibacteria group bacterium]